MCLSLPAFRFIFSITHPLPFIVPEVNVVGNDRNAAAALFLFGTKYHGDISKHFSSEKIIILQDL